MTRTEFAKAMAYVTAGCGHDLGRESLEVYFDCLGDVAYEVMILAAKRVLLDHKFATFPTIAELREAAVETARGRVRQLTGAEAWALAWRAAANTDPDVSGSFDRATRDLPPLVVRAMKAFGVRSLCCGDDPVSVVRGQFLKLFDQLAHAEERAAVLPAATRKAIEEVGKKQLAAATPDAPARPSVALSVAGWAPEKPA